MSLRHQYVDQPVTPWGGMQEMKKLIDKTGISKKLLELGLPEGKSNNTIDPVSIIESFWVSIWIGCFRFSHTAVLRVDEVLRELFGWKRVASGTTYGRFFKKFTPSMNHHLFIELYSWFFDQLAFDNYTLDVQSVPLEAKGCHKSAQLKSLEVYKAYQEHTCRSLILAAKTFIASTEYNKVLDILEQVDPSSPCSKEAEDLIKETSKKVDKLQKKEWDIALKIYGDNVALEKYRITAIKEIAVAVIKKDDNKKTGKDHPRKKYK